LERKGGFLLDKRRESFLINGNKLAFGLGNSRETSQLTIKQGHFSKDSSLLKSGKPLFAEVEFHFALFDDIHHVSRIPAYENDSPRRKLLKISGILK